MKRQNRRIALALALVMLLTPALALAVFDPNNVDISQGSVAVDSTNTTQGSDVGAHNGQAVNITDKSANPSTGTGNTVTVTTASGAVTPQVNVTDVTFTGPADSADHSAAITITGDGEASVALNGVSVTGDNPAIGVLGGGTVNLDLTGLDADIDGQGVAMSVNNATVNINVNGENTVDAEGIGMSVSNADVTVTGDAASDALSVTSASPSGTISGDGASTLAVEGKATLTAENTVGAEPIAESGPSVKGKVIKQTVGQTKTTTVTAPSGIGVSGSSSGSGKNKPVQIPTVEKLKAMTPEEVALLSPAVIAALTTDHIAVLTTDQIQALTEIQIQALTMEQIQALNAEQIAALTAEQMGAMSDKQKEALNARSAALKKAEDQQAMKGQTIDGQQPAQVQTGSGAVADAGQITIAEKGVENFLKGLRESNTDLPQNAAYPSGDTLVLNLNKIDNGIELGASADYKSLQRSNLASVTLEKDGASVVLDLQMLASEKPTVLNLAKGNADDEPASEFGFVCPDDDWSLYIEGIDGAQRLVLPVSTNGPYEVTINEKVVILNVTLINGKKVIQLPAVKGPGIFEIKAHGE